MTLFVVTMTDTAPRPTRFTAAGTRYEAFGPAEWSMFLGLVVVWGGSFLFMAEGLEVFPPALVTLWRVGLGAATMALVPAARRPIERQDWGRIVATGLLWIAIPFTLFPLAQQWIDSALAGMLNGAMPLWTAMIAVGLGATVGRNQLAGLGVGFAGVVAIGLPALGEGDTAALGVGLVVAATICYAVAANLAAPMQQKYGAIPVAAWALWIAAVAVAPWGLATVGDASWQWSSFAAMLAVGVLGTGVAFAMMNELIRRVGPTRASTITYGVPVMALFLGVTLRGEEIAPLSILGCGLVIAGAWLASRREA